MNKTLLNLIKTKLSLIEKCKTDSFHTMMIYSESLPSLLVQCIGYMEEKICHIRNKKKASLDKNTLDSLSKNWYERIDISILDGYRNIFTNTKNISAIKEFITAVEFLKSDFSLHDKPNEYIINQLIILNDYRNSFAHGKINNRRLSIISKQDFYVYFGILLLIDKCVDDITEAC